MMNEMQENYGLAIKLLQALARKRYWQPQTFKIAQQKTIGYSMQI
jgi:hypothetical protein